MQIYDSSIRPQVRVLGSLIVSLCLLVGFSSLQAQGDKKADEDYLSANRLFNLGLFHQAIDSYQKFLRNYPKHPKVINVRYGMGISHFQLKQYDKAAKLLCTVSGDPKCPDVPRANLFWGQSLLMLGKPANAEGAFGSGIKALPKTSKEPALQANLQVSQLEALFQQKKWKDVVLAAKSLKGKVGNRSTRVDFQGAYSLYKLKRFKEAGTLLANLKPSVKNTAYEQQTHFLLAESLREQKQIPLAIKEFEVTAALNGDFASEALYRLGFLQFNQRNYKAAVKHFDAFRVRFRGQVKLQQFQDAHIYLGRAQMELNQYKLAEKVFADLAAEPKNNAKVFLWQGRVLQRRKKYSDAIKILDGAIRKFPNNPETPNLLFDLAINNFLLGNFFEAGKAFDDLRKTKPDFGQMADLLRLNALCKFNARDFETSLKLCGEFLETYAQNVSAGDVKFMESEGQFFMGQYVKAISSYGSFLTSYKVHSEVNAAKMRIGQSHYKLKNWNKVLTVLEPLMKSDKEGLVFDQFEFLVADAHYQLGDWAKAVPVYLQFVETKPKSVNADMALDRAGHAFENLNKNDEAVAAYKKLVENYSDSDRLPFACLKLGEWYTKSGEYSKAKAVLQRVVALKEHNLRPEAEYKLAYVESEEGDAAEAARRFGLLADTYPQHGLAVEARLRQGATLLEAEQFSASQKALEKFIADYPTHEKMDNATYQLGFSQAKQEQWQEALVSFVKVPEKSRYRADALYQSAQCQKGAGKKSDAVPYYEELLAEFPESPLVNTCSLELAELEYEAKKLNEAIRRVQGLILKKPKKDLLVRAQQLLGFAYYDQKDFDQALLSFQDVVKASKPTRRSKGDELGAEAQFRMGQCYYEQEMFDKAIEEYKKTETGFPFPLWQSMAIYEMAVTLARKGDEVEEQEQLKRLIEKFPDTPAAAEAKAKLK